MHVDKGMKEGQKITFREEGDQQVSGFFNFTQFKKFSTLTCSLSPYKYVVS